MRPHAEHVALPPGLTGSIRTNSWHTGQQPKPACGVAVAAIPVQERNLPGRVTSLASCCMIERHVDHDMGGPSEGATHLAAPLRDMARGAGPRVADGRTGQAVLAHTSHSATASARLVSGSRTGMNSWAT